MPKMPKLWFEISSMLVTALTGDAGFSKRREEFIKDEGFRKAFAEKQSEILELIPQFTGYDWERSEIPVYLVPWCNKHSFSHPLVLFYRPDHARLWHILIHELVHINLANSEFKSLERRGSEGLEVVCWIVTLHVLRRIFGRGSPAEKDLLGDFAQANERNKQTLEGLRKIMDQWDLGKKPLKWYLEEGV